MTRALAIDPLAHIRAEVMALPERDRAEYALDILAYYLDPVPPFYEGCAALALDLPLPDLRVLFALDRRRGHFLSMDALLAARCADKPADDWDTHDKVIRSIARIRPRLKARGLPVEIENWQGVGYTLRAPSDFRFEGPGCAQVPPLVSRHG